MERNNSPEQYIVEGDAAMKKKDYAKAFDYYSEAITQNNDHTAALKKRAIASVAQYESGKYSFRAISTTVRSDMEGLLIAIDDCVRVMKTTPGDPDIYRILTKIQSMYPTNTSYPEFKTVLFAFITNLPEEIKIPMLEQCKDPNSDIGKLFWKREGALPCDLDQGTLKDICDYLSEYKNPRSAVNLHNKL